MRRFEFSEGSSKKFWQIELKGTSHTVTFGRIGQEGQSKTKSFGSKTEAEAAYQKLIREKVDKGYKEVSLAGKGASKASKDDLSKKLQKPSTKAAIPTKTPKQKTKTATIEETWDRLEAWLTKHVPKASKALQPPATEAALEKLERAIGRKLPSEIRQIYKKHNGQKSTTPAGYGLFFGLPWLSLDSMLKEWKTWNGADIDIATSCLPPDAVQPTYYDAGWIPISDDSGGNNIAIDTNPGSSGTAGQVIIFGRDDTFHPVLAKSFNDFLSDMLRELESGNYGIDTSENGFHFKGSPDHFHSSGEAWCRKNLGVTAGIQKQKPPKRITKETLDRKLLLKSKTISIPYDFKLKRDITDDDLALLEGHSSLESLLISSEEVTDEGLTNLAGIKSLTSLMLTCTLLTDNCLRHLAGLKNLEELTVQRATKFMGTGFKHLKNLNKLRQVSMKFNGLPDQNIDLLAEIPNLEDLYLGSHTITSAGLRRLSKLPKLTQLTIYGVKIDEEAVNALSKLKKLEQLEMSSIPQPTQEKLKKALPNCTIEFW